MRSWGIVANLPRPSGKRRVTGSIYGPSRTQASVDCGRLIIVAAYFAFDYARISWRFRMDKNPWNAQARITEIAGEYELSIYDDQGYKIAIATGRTEEDCRANAAAIIEGLKLRSSKSEG